MVKGIGLENRHTEYVSGVRIPSHPLLGHVAQLVEQLAYNEKVSGSSPLELMESTYTQDISVCIDNGMRVWWNW